MLLLLNVTRRTYTHTTIYMCRCVWVCVGVCAVCWLPALLVPNRKLLENQSYLYLFAKSCSACNSSNNACLAVLHHSAPPPSTPSLLLDTPRHDVVGVSSCVCVGMSKITRFIAYDCRYNLLICRTIFATSLPPSTIPCFHCLYLQEILTSISNTSPTKS